jgi:lipoprotein-releasing system permease protein
MQIPVELILARRYLSLRRRSAAITMLTWISVAGVIIGVAALLVVLAVMNGFQTELETRIVGTNAHVFILPPAGEATVDSVNALLGRIQTDGEVVAAAPFVFGKAMVTSETAVDGIAVKGIDPARERAVTRVLSNVEPPLRAETFRGIILGSQLATTLGVRAGDTVTLTAPAAPADLFSLTTPHVLRVPVEGTFTSGLFEFDSSLGYLSLDTARTFFGLSHGASGVEVRVRDLYRAPEVAQRFAGTLGPHVRTANWIEQNRNLFVWMRMEKLVMFLILSLIILVATFNIASSLSMAVIEKRRDMGILLSMGATRRLVQRAFVTMGAVIGLVGTGLGTLLGIGTAAALKRWPIVQLPGDVYFIDRLPVRMELSDVLLVAGASLLLCLLATLSPSRQAARLVPVEAIRTAE